MAEAPRCILLAGAPITEDLDWHEHKLLLRFDIHFTRILDGRRTTEISTQASSTLDPSITGLRWRSVELDDADDLNPGRQDIAVAQTQFLSFDDDRVDDMREHSNFLEHSIAVFHDLVSSQILGQTVADDAGGNTTTDFSLSFATTSATDSSVDAENVYSPVQTLKQCSAFDGPVSNLKQIPSADYIAGILPQTMTVNLMIGVVTVSPARSVQLRKSNAEMDIVELIVGDETRAGFTISFWLVPADSQNKPTDDLRHILSKLRAGDVVLLQNVALSSFRSCVYGQSLSKRFARNSTLITPMEDSGSFTLPANLYAKLQRVHTWACDFVEVGKQPASFVGDDTDAREEADALPPDTQG